MLKPATALIALAVALPAPLAAAADSSRLLPAAREEWLERTEPVIAGNARMAAAAADPLAAAMDLCAESGCTDIGRHTLNDDETARLRALFAGGEDSAEAERQRIGKAIALFETFIGPRNGTWRDHSANDREAFDEPNQLDCIAESVNTRTYLDRLSLAGLLHHHHVGGFIHRYTVVLQHVAVEIIADGDEEDGRFAVDSWVGANGDEPEILPYGDWRLEWGV